MYPTSEQSDTMRALSSEYGPPDRIMHENTFKPYGLVWYRWHKASISSQFPDRNLFIRPDGSRLTWTLIA